MQLILNLKMKSLITPLLMLGICFCLSITDIFPDYTDEEYGVQKPFHFDKRQLEEYAYFTEDEKDCQACLTRAWNHCRIDWNTHICCPPNNETELCTREL